MSQTYGQADDGVSTTTIRRAIDGGVTLLDTAMSYGRGHNERLVGRAIRGLRDRVVLATKFGIVRTPDGTRIDAHPGRVRDDCEASLRRLGVDHVDLYYLHRPDPQVPIEETIGAMAHLVHDGLVGHLGVSELGVDLLERAVATHPVSALQAEWSLWWRDIEHDLVPAARRLGVGLVTYGPLGRGFLTGAITRPHFAADDARRHDARFGDGNFERNLAVLAEVEHIAETAGATPGQLALAWLLAQGDDVVPIPGTKRPDRLDENLVAPSITLPDDVVRRLDEVAAHSRWAGDRLSFAGHRVHRA